MSIGNMGNLTPWRVRQVSAENSIRPSALDVTLIAFFVVTFFGAGFSFGYFIAMVNA